MIKKVSLVLLSTIIFTATPVLANDEADLKAGKPIIKESVNTTTKVNETQLVFLIKAKPEKIWDTLVDYDHYTDFMPIKEVKVKSRNGSYDIVFFKPEAPMGFDTSYELKRIYHKDQWKIEFEKYSGKIKSINGYWKFEPLNDKYTKVIYVNNIDIGLPVPGFVKDYFTKGSLRKLAEGVKKRVETNGKWKKS